MPKRKKKKSYKTPTCIVKQPDRHKKQSVSPILPSSSNQKDISLRKHSKTLPLSIEQPNSSTNLLPSLSSESHLRDNLSPPNSQKNNEKKDGEEKEKARLSL